MFRSGRIRDPIETPTSPFHDSSAQKTQEVLPRYAGRFNVARSEEAMTLGERQNA